MLRFLRILFGLTAAGAAFVLGRALLSGAFESAPLPLSVGLVYAALAAKPELLSDSASVPDSDAAKLTYQLGLVLLGLSALVAFLGNAPA